MDSGLRHFDATTSDSEFVVTQQDENDYILFKGLVKAMLQKRQISRQDEDDVVNLYVKFEDSGMKA